MQLLQVGLSISISHSSYLSDAVCVCVSTYIYIYVPWRVRLFCYCNMVMNLLNVGVCVYVAAVTLFLQLLWVMQGGYGQDTPLLQDGPLQHPAGLIWHRLV